MYAFETWARRQGTVSIIILAALFAVIINLAIVFLINIGAIQVEQGILTQGQVVALYNYMSQILVELIKLANLIITINKALACGNRIADVFSVQSSMEWNAVANCPTDDEQQVEFRHVSLRYHQSGDEALTDINFVARKGETIGIIGGTGSGKS